MGKLAFGFLLMMLGFEIISYFNAVGKPRRPVEGHNKAFHITNLVLSGLKLAATWYIWSLSEWNYRTLGALVLTGGYVVYTILGHVQINRQLKGKLGPKTRRAAIIETVLNLVEATIVLLLAFAGGS